MKCVENVIVTLYLQPERRQLDMELPAFLPVRQLREQLLEILSQIDPLGCGRAAQIRLYRDTQPLQDGLSLAQQGIWDGSCLNVRREEG